jgi:hypothetical protein
VLHLREKDGRVRVPDSEVRVHPFLRAEVAAQDPGARFDLAEGEGGEEGVRGGSCLIDVRNFPEVGGLEAGLVGLSSGGFFDKLVLCARFRYASVVDLREEEEENQ